MLVVKGQTVRLRISSALLLIAVCFALANCDSAPQTLWRSDSRSPDGKFVATARSQERSAVFDSTLSGTTVELNWTSGSQNPQLILVFEDFPTAPDFGAVGMHWDTPNHLDVTYKGKRNLVFQVVKCRGVDISVRELPASGAIAQEH